jgi:hypothetical protein
MAGTLWRIPFVADVTQCYQIEDRPFLPFMSACYVRLAAAENPNLISMPADQAGEE